VAVRSISGATLATVFPDPRTRRTASALSSGVNRRRLRFQASLPQVCHDCREMKHCNSNGDEPRMHPYSACLFVGAMLRCDLSGMPFLGGRGQVTRAFVPAAVMCAALWASSAAAEPARITAPGVDAFDAPSKASVVVSKLEGGAQVCVLDASNYAGTLHRRHGWIAIRVPGGVGYVPIEAIDSSVPAAAADPGASASGPQPRLWIVHRRKRKTSSAKRSRSSGDWKSPI
jgi:hypothetical protein